MWRTSTYYKAATGTEPQAQRAQKPQGRSARLRHRRQGGRQHKGLRHQAHTVVGAQRTVGAQRQDLAGIVDVGGVDEGQLVVGGYVWQVEERVIRLD